MEYTLPPYWEDFSAGEKYARITDAVFGYNSNWGIGNIRSELAPVIADILPWAFGVLVGMAVLFFGIRVFRGIAHT